MNNVENNYWKKSEEERRKKDEHIIQRQKKMNYWYIFLNAFIHICIVLASLTIISERTISQSPGVTLSIFMGSVLTFEFIYFLVKKILVKK